MEATPGECVRGQGPHLGVGGDGVKPLNANLGGRFTFGGTSYLGGVPTDEVLPANVSGFTGTLSATGTDGWIRDPRFPANSRSFLLDGAGYSPRGAWDLFFFQLKP